MRLILIFLAEFVVFLLASINQRACAKYKMGPTLITDGLIAGVNFTLIKWIAEASNPWEQLIFILGAVTGSWMGMKLTYKWEKLN